MSKKIRIVVPALRDLIQQSEGNYKVPEIRVWCHPGKGDDYYNVFDTFKEAMAFIEHTKESEEIPLVAVNGYEINVFGVKEVKI